MWGPLVFFLHLASFAYCHGNSDALDETKESAIPTIHPVPINQALIPDEYLRLSVVGKCCKLNEILVKNESDMEATCIYSNSSRTEKFIPYFHEFNETGIMVPSIEENEFVAIIGNPCKFRRYILEPSVNSEDEYYLLQNGSIYAPSPKPIMLMPGVDYCMEVVPQLGVKALVCFSEVAENEPVVRDPRLTVYACGLLISVPFLLLTIAAYATTPRLMDVHGKALCLYCGCLALAFATLALVQLASAYISDEICISIAFIIQFSFVACFFWLNVLCIETYLLVKKHVARGGSSSSPRIEPGRLFFYYSLWAWGPPAILIFVSIVMDLSPTIPMTYIKPHFGANSCWFNSNQEAMPYFYVPVSMLVLINLVLFALTALELARYQRNLDLRRLRGNQESNGQEQRLYSRIKRTFFVCLGLFFLMGINWMMELISWWTGGDSIAWSTFDLFNALQGLIVFMLFVLRQPVRSIVWYRLQKLRGVHASEPELGNMALSLLPIINGGDTLPRERIS